MLTTILRVWLLLRKGFLVICAYTSEGAEESLWRLCQGEGTAFPRGLPLPVPSWLLQQPERVEREETAPARISHNTTICCFFRSKNIPRCVFNGTVICIPAIVNDCGGYLVIASVFSKLIGGLPLFTVEHTVNYEVFKYLR